MRAYLLFARMGIDRAYMFWYQDDGPEKGMHNADGLLSKGEKQPAWYAMASLKALLGDYRFERVLAEDLDAAYAYLMTAGEGQACVAVWSPTFDGEARPYTLDLEAAGLTGFDFVRAATFWPFWGDIVPFCILVGQTWLWRFDYSKIYRKKTVKPRTRLDLRKLHPLRKIATRWFSLSPPRHRC